MGERVRILVEQVESVFVTTSFDEYGAVTSVERPDRERAVRVCKRRTRDILSPSVQFTAPEDLSSE